MPRIVVTKKKASTRMSTRKKDKESRTPIQKEKKPKKDKDLKRKKEEKKDHSKKPKSRKESLPPPKVRKTKLKSSAIPPFPIKKGNIYAVKDDSDEYKVCIPEFDLAPNQKDVHIFWLDFQFNKRVLNLINSPDQLDLDMFFTDIGVKPSKIEGRYLIPMAEHKRILELLKDKKQETREGKVKDPKGILTNLKIEIKEVKKLPIGTGKSKKMTKAEERRAMFELHPQPSLPSFTENKILTTYKITPQQKFPYNGISIFMNNLEPIYRTCHGDESSMKSLLKNTKDISTVFQYYSCDMKLNAIHYSILTKNYQIFKLLATHAKKIQDGTLKISRAPLPVPTLQTMGTGVASKFNFRFAPRPIEMSRGGKEGNNAFTHDNPLYKVKYQDMKELYEMNIPPDMVNFIFSYQIPLLDRNTLIEDLPISIRNGHYKLAHYLLKLAFKTVGWKVNALHYKVLEAKEIDTIRKVSVIKKGPDDITPIHVACINPDTTHLKRLLNIVPKYDMFDWTNRKLAHFAAACEGDGPLKYLMSKKSIDLNEGCAGGFTPMMIACLLGRTDNVKALIKYQNELINELDENDEEYNSLRKSLDFINTETSTKNTPAHFATKRGNLECVKLLVEAKAEFSTVNFKGFTPLMLAAAKGHFDVVKYLIENEAGNPIDVNKKGKHALIYAIINGHIHIVSYLLQYGINPNLHDTSANSPLHYAAAYGWKDICDLLVKAGSKLNSSNSWKVTPPAVAILKGHFGCADFLLKQPGVNANYLDENGKTLVSLICSEFGMETLSQLEFLLNNCQIDCTLTDKDGLSALHHLAANNLTEIVKRTEEIENRDDDEEEEGAELAYFGKSVGKFANRRRRRRYYYRGYNQSVNKKMDSKLLKLKQIFSDKLIKCAELLIGNGADINLVDEGGATPLSYGLMAENEDLVLWLLKKGSDLKGVNPEDLSQNFLHVLGNSLKLKQFDVILSLISKRPKQELKELKKMAEDEDDVGRKPIHNLFQNAKEVVNSKDDVEEEDEEEEEEEDSDEEQNIPTKKKRTKIQEKQFQKKSKEEKLEILENKLLGMINFFEKSLGAEITSKIGLSKDGKKKVEKMKLKGLSQQQIQEAMEKINEDESDGNRPRRQMRKRPVKRLPPRSKYARRSNKNTESDKIMGTYKDIDSIDKNYFETKTKFGLYYNLDEGETNILHQMTELPFFSKLTEFLLKKNKEFDEPSIIGETPLYKAIRADRIELVEALLKAGHSPFSQTKKYLISPLHLVAEKSIDGIELMLKSKNLQVDLKDLAGNTPLHYAAKQRSFEILSALIEKGANVNAVNKEDRNALHISLNQYESSSVSNVKLEELLIKKKINLNAEDIHKRTPIFYTLVKDEDEDSTNNIDPIEPIQLLLKTKKIKINHQDIKGNTLVHYTCQRGAPISLLNLIQENAQLEIQNKQKNTPMAVAFLSMHFDLVIFLIQSKAKINVDIWELYGEKKGAIPYDNSHIITKNKYEEMLKMNDEDILSRKTPFHFAIQEDLEGILFLLFQNGYEPFDALVGSIKVNNYDFILRLLEKYDEKDVNKLTASGKNLHNLLAAKIKSTYHVKADPINSKLLEYHINPANKDRNGRDSYFFALKFGNIKFLQKLLENKTSSELTKILNMKDKKMISGFVSYLIKHQLHVNTLKQKKKVQTRNKQWKKKDSDPFYYIRHLIKTQKIKIDLHFQLIRQAKDNLEKRDERFLDIPFDKLDQDHIFKTHPLIHAAQKDDFNLFYYTLSLDDNLAVTDNTGRNVMHWAIKNNSEKVLEYIIEGKNSKYMSRINPKVVDEMMRKVDNDKRTPISYIFKNNDFGAFNNVKMLNLLSKRFKLDFHQKEGGKSPIQYASEMKDKIMLEELKKLGVKVPQLIEKKSTLPKLKKSNSKKGKAANFENDCEKYLDLKIKEEQHKKKQSKIHDQDEVQVDENAELGPTVKVVKGEEFYYDALMVKVDVSRFFFGIAMFYKMQLLYDSIKKIYIVWTRWGRIGDIGQFQRTPFNTLQEGEKEFTKIFKQKTGTLWSKVGYYEPIEKKFELKELEGKSLVFRKPSPELKKIEFSVRNLNIKSLIKPFNLEKTIKSSLPDYLQDLAKLMVDSKIFSQYKNNYGDFNLSSSILSALDKKTIKAASEILNQIKDEIELREKEKKKGDLTEYNAHMQIISKLSNKYYELIAPTDYRYEKIQPILNLHQFKEEKKKLSELYDIEVAFKIILGAKYCQKQINVYDYCMKSLGANLSRIPEDSLEYMLLFKSASNTYFANSFTFMVKDILKIDDSILEYEDDYYNKLHNHFMLFHGTSPSNLLSILQSGLKISPMFTGRAGNLFGEGIYFSNVLAKSINYCQEIENYRIILVCDVALGNIYSIDTVNSNITHPPKNYHSVRIISRNSPKKILTTQEGNCYSIGVPDTINNYFVEIDGKEYSKYGDYLEDQRLLRKKAHKTKNSSRKKKITKKTTSKKKKQNYSDDEENSENHSSDSEEDEMKNDLEKIDKDLDVESYEGSNPPELDNDDSIEEEVSEEDIKKYFENPEFIKNGLRANQFSEFPQFYIKNPKSLLSVHVNNDEFIVFNPSQFSRIYQAILPNDLKYEAKI